MATEAQNEANRRNAEKSTGPTTPEGKQRASGNATRHGFCSSRALMSEENRAEFDEFLCDLMNEHQPASPTEKALVYKMAQSAFFTWHIGKFLSERLDQNGGEDDSKQLPLMFRYYNTQDRAFNKNLNDLRKLQKERKIEGFGFVSQNTGPQPVETLPTLVYWPGPNVFDDEPPTLDGIDSPKTADTPPQKAA